MYVHCSKCNIDTRYWPQRVSEDRLYYFFRFYPNLKLFLKSELVLRNVALARMVVNWRWRFWRFFRGQGAVVRVLLGYWFLSKSKIYFIYYFPWYRSVGVRIPPSPPLFFSPHRKDFSSKEFESDMLQSCLCLPSSPLIPAAKSPFLWNISIFKMLLSREHLQVIKWLLNAF